MSDDTAVATARTRRSRSATVPRGTVQRAERLSVRVPVTLKQQVRDTVAELQALGTSESELVEMLVSDSLQATLDELEARVRDWRVAPGHRSAR